MAELLDTNSWSLSTADLIQQIATLVWLHKGDEQKDLLKMVTGARVAHELYTRVSREREIEKYEGECLLGICEFVKKNPRASEKELTEEVTKQIMTFKTKVEAL